MPSAIPVERAPRAHHAFARVAVTTVMWSIGVVLIGCAVAVTQAYLDRHFLPSFLMPREWFVRLEYLGRAVVAATGVTLALLAKPAGRFVQRDPALALASLFAVVLAFAAGEFVLGKAARRPSEWLFVDQEPLRREDRVLGWTYVPSRHATVTSGGRPIEYALDAAGYRVREAGDTVDVSKPSVLFTGESVMFGSGLTWEESIPAQAGQMMRVHSVNLAVHGYSSGQALKRLETELPRFSQPVAVVSLFMPSLFGRNLNKDRPHFGPGLAWSPALPGGRLRSLLQLVAPYRSMDAVEQGIATTREVLRATADVANVRGAAALVVVPQFGPEEPMERTLRRRILDEGKVRYVFVTIDPAWRLAWDRHPDARAARAIAAAIAEQLSVTAPPTPVATARPPYRR
jgi:hypothetical protein